MDRRITPSPGLCTPRPTRPAPLCAGRRKTLTGHTKTGISLDRPAACITNIPACIKAAAKGEPRIGKRALRTAGIALPVSNFVMRVVEIALRARIVVMCAAAVALRAGLTVMRTGLTVMRTGRMVMRAGLTVMRTLLVVSPLAASEAPANRSVARPPALVRHLFKKEPPAAAAASPGRGSAACGRA